MRAYKIVAADGDTVLATRYAGTSAASREARDALVEQFGIKKKDVSIEDCEIPTSKPELLEFVNELAASADAVEAEDES